MLSQVRMQLVRRPSLRLKAGNEFWQSNFFVSVRCDLSDALRTNNVAEACGISEERLQNMSQRMKSCPSF
jgi:hypothetical protein